MLSNQKKNQTDHRLKSNFDKNETGRDRYRCSPEFGGRREKNLCQKNN